MSPCCWCEGCHLGPKKRLEDNPRLGMHVSCFLEIVKTDSEIEAVLSFLKKNSEDIGILKERLQSIEDFWKRSQRIQEFHKQLRREREEQRILQEKHNSSE